MPKMLSRTKQRRLDARTRQARWIIGLTSAITLTLALGLVAYVAEPWYTLLLLVPMMVLVSMKPAAMALGRGEPLPRDWFWPWFRWTVILFLLATIALGIRIAVDQLS